MRIRVRFLPLSGVLLALACGTQPDSAGWRTAAAKFEKLKTFKQEIVAERGVVASNHPLASAAGQLILAKGGNAVDALIATFFALSVVEPAGMSPFGSGFINLYTKDGEAVTLDNYTTAPAAARPDLYRLVHPEDEEEQAKAGSHLTVGDENLTGFKAIGVPGGMKAWLWVLKRYGSGILSLREILAPALDYAENGFIATRVYAGGVRGMREKFARFPGWMEEFVPGGTPPDQGSRVRRPGYAVTLRALAEAAPADAPFAQQLEAAAARFYKGDIARNITGYVQKNGGLLTLDDLAWYFGGGLDDLSENQGLRLRTPLRGAYRGYEIIAMPPTSSGGTHLIEILNILEGFDLGSLGFGNPKRLHLIAEAMKIAWADRDAYMGDPDYAGKDPSFPYPPPPIAELTSKEYASRRRKEIDEAKPGAYRPGEFGSPRSRVQNQADAESPETTHATAMDSEGNVISMTQTVHRSFGSGVVLPGRVPGSGLVLNDTMELFDPDPRTGFERANAIAPHKRMLSSMTPTIVLKDGKPFLAIGTPGGTRIYSAVLQGILNVIDHGMSIQQAVEAPRIWTMMYGDLQVERGFPKEVIRALKTIGHPVADVPAVAGGMNGVLRDTGTGLIHGGACWRADGAVAGWSGGDAWNRQRGPYPSAWDDAR